MTKSIIKIINDFIPEEYLEEKGKLIDETLEELRKEYSECITALEKQGFGFISTGLCIHTINIYSRKVRENMKNMGIILSLKQEEKK